MTITVEMADSYFENEVFLNDLWTSADIKAKSRALKNAENMLYRFYTNLDPVERPVPNVAIFEQAYFIMLVDETIQRSAHGVKQVSVSGMTVSVESRSYPISPEAKIIIQNETGEIGGNGATVRVGRYAL